MVGNIVATWDLYFHFEYDFEAFEGINMGLIAPVIVLGGLLLALIILFGKWKGIRAIISLGFIFSAVFLVLVPAILSDFNIYLSTVIVGVFAILSALLIFVGVNKKALASIIGCFGGIALAGLLVVVMDIFLQFAIRADTNIMDLRWILDREMEARPFIFASIVIGSIGAVMDTAVSISSPLWELKKTGAISDFTSFWESGINIGRDILGTMLNTLVLAYIGSAFSLVLLLSVFSHSALEILNMEMVIVVILQALIGGFGMLVTIPLTIVCCGYLYTSQPQTAQAL